MNSIGRSENRTAHRDGRRLRRIQLAVAIAGGALAEIDEHLEALIRVRRFPVKPDGGAIALEGVAPRQHAVGAGLDIEVGTFPADAVLADSVADAVEPAGVIPHLEQAVFRIVKDTVAERASHRTVAVVHLERSFRLEERARGVYTRFMKSAAESGVAH